MQGSAWVQLLRLLPPEHLDKLMLITVNGTEINLQSVLRTDPDYLTIRGRLAASTEAGRVFFIPYDQICLLGYKEGIPEAKIQEMFGTGSAALTNGLSKAADRAVPGDGTGSPRVSESAKSSRTSLQPAKAALLERLRRARNGQDTPKHPSR